MALALSILVVNVAALVAYAIAGEAIGYSLLTIVGLCDTTVGVIALLRFMRERTWHAAVAVGLVTLVFETWPFPIYTAARVVTPSDGQAIGEGFITIFAALWAIIAGVATANRLRFEQQRSN